MYYQMEALIAQLVELRLHFRGAEFESQHATLTFQIISLASTVQENIVRKPACLRVLHNVLKGVWSPPIRTRPEWWA
ncbi:jg17388 [Pararge aegeria aegeria]|uniref:Jg17388 protein n=1 Tax=Pararge aegeria aegeria TaxID=348720 RepID=A0A8S4S0R2_9NEOP|nr:jg17388 [Pararge aegeria aegeria]